MIESLFWFWVGSRTANFSFMANLAAWDSLNEETVYAELVVGLSFSLMIFGSL